MMGGENRRSILTLDRDYSEKAQRTCKAPSYLEPNSGSLHVPIEGVYSAAEKTEGRVAIGEKTGQNHVEKQSRAYLERIRNSMHEPIEGRSAQYVHGL